MHFVFDFHKEQGLDQLNGRMLELFVECIADSISQRRTLLLELPLFKIKRIVVDCCSDNSTFATESEDEKTQEKLSILLLSNWQLLNYVEVSDLNVAVDVNLAKVRFQLDSVSDASFQADCTLFCIDGLMKLIGQSLSSELESIIKASASRTPRVMLKQIRRTVDVPEFSSPKIPQTEQYKVARKNLAVILRKHGVEPGKYELLQAKKIIDLARNEFRSEIHSRIDKYESSLLLLFCIEQHDALINEYQRKVIRLKQSLEHEVSYDIPKALAEAYKEFTNSARNYRYLLEYCLSSQSVSAEQVTTLQVTEIIASVDWLFVLYNASDILHNDIDVGGIKIDHNFIPEIFYSADRCVKEHEFLLEMASMDLGIDLVREDEVTLTQKKDECWRGFEQTFIKEVGFSFINLTQILSMLAHWYTVGGADELHHSYQATIKDIVERAVESIPNLTIAEAHLIVDFLTLEPSKIRRLPGKSVDESDVPVWEHTKRLNRYTIRPLIPIKEGIIAWGAGSTNHATSIWTGSVSNGYLPADFNWPQVKNIIREIKEGIEKELEVRAFEVCSRATPHLKHGINFKYRFPKDGFDDVGDFDVLAYWPETNTWLSVECKYNQPPFCLKDTRRLRDRIFGSESEDGQFSKIERRRSFLESKTDRLRNLLSWPKPVVSSKPVIVELYVSRDIYWWMRNPPIPIPTHFVRIDMLDNWLQEQEFSANSTIVI